MYGQINFSGHKLHCEVLLDCDYRHNTIMGIRVYRVMSGDLSIKHVVVTNNRDEGNSIVSQNRFKTDKELIDYLSTKINDDDMAKINTRLNL